VIQRHFSLMIKLTWDWSNYERYAFARILKGASYSYWRSRSLVRLVFRVIHHHSNGSRNREASAERFLVTDRCRLIGDVMIVQTFLIAANGLANNLRHRRGGAGLTVRQVIGPGRGSLQRDPSSVPFVCFYRRAWWHRGNLPIALAGAVVCPRSTGHDRSSMRSPKRAVSETERRVRARAHYSLIVSSLSIDVLGKRNATCDSSVDNRAFGSPNFLLGLALSTFFMLAFEKNAYSSCDLIFCERFSAMLHATRLSSFFIFLSNNFSLAANAEFMIASAWKKIYYEKHELQKLRNITAARTGASHVRAITLKNQERERKRERERERRRDEDCHHPNNRNDMARMHRRNNCTGGFYALDPGHDRNLASRDLVLSSAGVQSSEPRPVIERSFANIIAATS